MDWKWILKYRVLRQPRPWTDPEPAVTAALLQMTGDLFVDVGSNRKRYAQLLQANFKKVITVDPNPRWEADRVLALADYSGVGIFWKGDGNGGGDGIIRQPHILGREWMTKAKHWVRIRRFDELGLDADLAKVDVEGSELLVMEGMRNRPPKTLVVELHDPRRSGELLMKGLSLGYARMIRLDETHFEFTHLQRGWLL